MSGLCYGCLPFIYNRHFSYSLSQPCCITPWWYHNFVVSQTGGITNSANWWYHVTHYSQDTTEIQLALLNMYSYGHTGHHSYVIIMLSCSLEIPITHTCPLTSSLYVSGWSGNTRLKAHSHESGSYLDSLNVDRILLPANTDLIRIPFTCAKEEAVPMQPLCCGQHPSPRNEQRKNPRQAITTLPVALLQTITTLPVTVFDFSILRSRVLDLGLALLPPVFS